LLESIDVKIDNKSISKDQLKTYIQQKPNKKIVGARFHLWLHNSSKPDKDNKWNEWLRKNGEEPVIWQQGRTDNSVINLARFLQNKGYYYADVTDTVILKKKKADVIYHIKTGWPYTINKVTYSISDTSIARLVLADTLNTLIKPGILLDEDIMKAEFKRMETNLKNSGYYSFTEGNIKTSADTTNLNRKTNLEIIVKPYSERTEDNQLVEMPYPLYHIRSVKVNAGLDMQNLMESANARNAASDTLKQGEISFIIPQYFPVRASTIRSAMFIFPDSLYRISNVNQTYQHLNGLRNFKQITPEFTELPGQTGLPLRELDCMISLLPLPRQNFKTELEGTNSEGNLGGGASFQYQNKSLFSHAEIFELRLRGLVEAVSGEKNQFKAKMEYEAEASLNIPQFLLPFPSSRFTQKYNPKTTFSILYNYQQYPEYYVRTVFNTSFGYNWRGSDVTSHLVKPLDVNFVQLPNQYLSETFKSKLSLYPYLRNSYQSHMVVSSSYTFVRDMRQVKRDNAFFIRTNFETAGLLLDAVYRMANQTSQPDKSFEMFGNEFSQFIKGDIDLRYFHTINNNNRMVVRTFAGVGLPYGNSKTTVETDEHTSKTVVAMPFEKKYYAGGANSLRGWRLRSLGPGSYKDSLSLTSYPNNTGDIKLEANLEYRFKLVWVIEGALFMDAGNVWDMHKDDDRPGANFSFDRFYREIALSGGLGFRFDFKYVILRADLGMKLRDPAGSGRWAFTPRPGGSTVRWNDFCLSIAIGYPFF
jgi:outer membrane protein assembly factor BamA